MFIGCDINQTLYLVFNTERLITFAAYNFRIDIVQYLLVYFENAFIATNWRRDEIIEN